MSSLRSMTPPYADWFGSGYPLHGCGVMDGAASCLWRGFNLGTAGSVASAAVTGTRNRRNRCARSIPAHPRSGAGKCWVYAPSPEGTAVDVLQCCGGFCCSHAAVSAAGTAAGNGCTNGWLGPALFLLGLSSTLGLQIARFAGRLRYRSLALLCGGGVLMGTFLASTPWLPAVLGRGFLAGALDDILDVRSDVTLNEMVPSCQRATLVSVSSLVYSLVMLAVAPLLGALFSVLSY